MSEAYYDPENDVIRGCTPYSYAWFHERRHQTQFKLIPKLVGINRNLHIYSYAVTTGALLSILIPNVSFKLGIFLMGISILPYTFFNLILEIDAMIFGTIDWIKNKP